MVWIIGHVSGANINPAVSIALLFAGESNFIKVLLYIPLQLSGSCLAIFTLNEMLKNEYTQEANTTVSERLVKPIGLTLLHQNITPVQGCAVEALITFILMITVFACIDKKRKDLQGSFPLSIGLAITVGALFGVNLIKYFQFKWKLIDFLLTQG